MTDFLYAKDGSVLDIADSREDMMIARYSQRASSDHTVCTEDRDDICRRVAGALAKKEGDYRNILEAMMNVEYIPAGRTLTNAGATSHVVPNCVVLGLEDDLQSIMNTISTAVLLQRSGCGIGFHIGSLRPAKMRCRASRGEASGPVSFLKAYNEFFGTIKQQGRHGANMATMRIDHPDILDFITCKAVEGEISNFNISVLLTGEFMERVRSKDPRPWMGKWKDEEMPLRRVYRETLTPNALKHSLARMEKNIKEMETLVSPDVYARLISSLEEHQAVTLKAAQKNTPRIERIEEVTMTAEELFNVVVAGAHRNGEPGFLFPESADKKNPFLETLGPYSVTNPCGEQFLHGGFTKKKEIWGDTCNLGSINFHAFIELSNVVTQPPLENSYTGKNYQYCREILLHFKDGQSQLSGWSFEKNKVEAFTVVHYLCKSVDLAKIKNVRFNVARFRRAIRTAIRASDAVIDLFKFPIEGFELTSLNHRRIGLGPLGLADMFAELGIGFGEPLAKQILRFLMDVFSQTAHDESCAMAAEFGVFPEWAKSSWGKKNIPRRNAAVTCAAPCGAIGALWAQRNSGIEPFFDLAYWYDNLTNRESKPQVVIPYVDTWFEFFGYFLDRDGLREKIKRGGVFESDAVAEIELKRIFACSPNLTPAQHVGIQATVQEYVENSVSKTINMGKTTTPEQVHEAIFLLFDSGCCGGTVYVDQSREQQVLRSYAEADENDETKRKTVSDNEEKPNKRLCSEAEAEDEDEDEDGTSSGTCSSEHELESPPATDSGDQTPTIKDRIMLNLSNSGQFGNCRGGVCQVSDLDIRVRVQDRK